MTTTRAGRLRPALAGLLVVYLCFLAFVLLWPRGEMPTSSVAFLTDVVQRLGADPTFVTAARVEVVSNVLIMVPLALLGRLLRPGYSWRDWTAVGFVIATSVELLQGFFLAGRSASAMDVVANTTGVAIGAILGSALRVLGRRRDPDDRDRRGPRDPESAQV